MFHSTKFKDYYDIHKPSCRSDLLLINLYTKPKTFFVDMYPVSDTYRRQLYRLWSTPTQVPNIVVEVHDLYRNMSTKNGHFGDNQEKC